MFEYDESLEQPVSGWVQRVFGALLAVAVFGVAWMALASLGQALAHQQPLRSQWPALIALPVLAWCSLVAWRLLSGDFGSRYLMPAWLFTVVGILFAIATVVLLALAVIGHVDVGADSILATTICSIGCTGFGHRLRAGD
jgi:hypothetical protein